MKKVKIVVDSTSDLMPEFLKEHDVDVLPLYVTFNQEAYKDGIDINVPELYRKVTETTKLPKTAAVSLMEFSEAFKQYVDEGYEVLVITISSKLSSCFQNAIAASLDYPDKVFVHDSYNLSTGIGLQVLKAIKMRDQGMGASEILEGLKKLVMSVRAQFAIESLDYLYKGGRCSSLVYIFGKGFKIKPIIRVVDGGMGVFKKPRGKMKNALDGLLQIFKEDLPNIDLDTVMITHSMAEESKNYLYEELSKIIDPKHIMITEAGCVISSHCGEGTIGILYILK